MAKGDECAFAEGNPLRFCLGSDYRLFLVASADVIGIDANRNIFILGL
jgi:hypothetical protein